MTDRGFDPVAHARAVRASGFWLDKPFDEFLATTIAATPDKLAIIADRADRDQPRRIAYSEFGDFIARAAGALRNMGIAHGDVVAVQLPNWWEFAVLALACGRIGAIVNPLMPIFPERELGFMLDFAEAKVLVTPKSFRGFDHEAIAAGMMLRTRLGSTIVLQDAWEARRGVMLMAAERVTFTAGASPFLSDICEAVAAGAPRPSRLRSFLCAGAPIPPALIERAARELDLKVCSLWGMTESLASTLTEPERALEKSSKTDGRPVEGVAVKDVRMDGSPAAVGGQGLLKGGGAQMLLGYDK